MIVCTENEKFKQVIREKIKEIMELMILSYYHKYKNDKDTFEQIFNTIVDMMILDSDDLKILHNEIIEDLETKYFYKIEDTKPLKIESIL